MPIVLLNHWTQQFSTPSEQAFLGITMMLVGVSLVFAILVIISLSIGLMSRLISGQNKKSAGPTAEAAKPEAAAKPARSAVVKSEDNGAIIAAITAAIQMMLAKEGGDSASAGFRIKKIRRV